MAIIKGSKVRIKRKESYWFNEVGVVVSREKEPNKSRYPITVRFEKVNYNGMQGVDGGLTTNNYARWSLMKSWNKSA
ncbi:photosystem I reaction center subunit IV [Synechococcus sp. AH-601-L23]|nr:photosystem I reaction center subunit IV [Synechococcus sp. AH-601-L23]